MVRQAERHRGAALPVAPACGRFGLAQRDMGVQPVPPDLAVVWHASIARDSIAHTFRFFTQTLTWTTPKPRRPEAADRWTWLLLLLLAYVHFRLARDQIAGVH